MDSRVSGLWGTSIREVILCADGVLSKCLGYVLGYACDRALNTLCEQKAILQFNIIPRAPQEQNFVAIDIVDSCAWKSHSHDVIRRFITGVLSIADSERRFPIPTFTACNV